MLCYVMLWNEMIYMIWYDNMMWYVMLCYVMLCYVMLCSVSNVMSCYVMLCYVMLPQQVLTYM